MKRHARFRLILAGSTLLGLTAAVAPGPAPALAVPGLTLVTAVSPLDSASSKEALAQCPSGTRVLGGGGYVEGGGRQVHFVRLQALGSSDRFAAGAAENGRYAENWRVYAYGICGRAPAGLEYVSFLSPRNSNAFKQVSAKCTPGKRVVSAGARIHNGNGNVLLQRFVPGVDLVEVEAGEVEGGYPGDWMVWAHAVCADPLPGWQLVVSTTPSDSADKMNTVLCPAGTRLHGVGSAVNGASEEAGQAIHTAVVPSVPLSGASTIVLEDATGIGTNWFTSLVAVCAT